MIFPSFQDCIFTLILFWALLLPFTNCAEEYQREIFLSPRNFNPHPYEHQLAKIQDPGPVVFPVNPEAEESVVRNRYNIITVDNAGRKYPIDITPYAKVAEKIKQFLDKKYTVNQQNQIEGELFDALAHQGAKVLAYPPQELKNYEETNIVVPKKNNYAFAYKVLDKATGDDFSHQQIRNAKATNGEYRVKLPDGRLQIVSYKADKHGYKADVRYEVDPEAQPQPQYVPHQNAVPVYVPQKQVPVRQYVTRQKTSSKSVKTYDYVASEESDHQVESLSEDPNIALEHQGPTQLPVKYIDVPVHHQTTPNPLYYVEGPIGPTQNYPSNVHIYTSNPQDNHIHGGYAQTTPSTPQAYDFLRYTPTPAPPSYAKQQVQAHYTPTPATPTYASQQQLVHYRPTAAAPTTYDGHYTPTAITPSYEKQQQQQVVRYSPTAATPTVHAQVVHNGDRGLFNPVASSYDPPSVPGHNNVINTLSSSTKQNDAYRQTLEQENELPEGIYIVGKPRRQ